MISDDGQPGNTAEAANPLSRLINELATTPDLVSSASFDRGFRQIRARLERYGSLSSEDADDIASYVFIKLADRVKKHGPLLTDAYVYATARHAMIDHLRRGRNRARELPVPTEDLAAYELASDDAVSSAFEATETAATVVAALQKARLAGDQTAYLIVTTALNETQRLGKRPSNRQLAQQLQVSHTTVNNALNRFREYLDVDQR